MLLIFDIIYVKIITLVQALQNFVVWSVCKRVYVHRKIFQQRYMQQRYDAFTTIEIVLSRNRLPFGHDEIGSADVYGKLTVSSRWSDPIENVYTLHNNSCYAHRCPYIMNRQKVESVSMRVNFVHVKKLKVNV